MDAVQSMNYSNPGSPYHERSQSRGMRLFIHTRNNSDGTNLPSSFNPSQYPASAVPDSFDYRHSHDMGLHGPLSGHQALGEWQHNRQGHAPPSPTKARRQEDGSGRMGSPRSPSKSTFASISAKFSRDKDTKGSSPTKPKKTKSATNLVGLLSRPKSSKNLSKLANEADTRRRKDKENRTPPSSLADLAPPTPIFAQFSRQGIPASMSTPCSPLEVPEDPFLKAGLYNNGHATDRPTPGDRADQKQRPRSFQPPHTNKKETPSVGEKKHRRARSNTGGVEVAHRSSTWDKGRSTSRGRVLTALSHIGHKSKSPSPSTPEVVEPVIDPKDIDKHLEAMLDRRNIPENQRYKMRNLNNTIKMEFIRQDWAESEAKKLNRPPTNDSEESVVSSRDGSLRDAEKKHSRGKSFTFSRNSWRLGGSPTKSKKKESTLGRHARTKSADSIVSDRPSSAGSSSSIGIMAKVIGQQVPSDYVGYLRKVQKPQLVEVGKLHKLRLLLRNERVAWAEDFIRQGGMKEIVELLHRIMEVEWREEHEDALLHENLLCLKALCTTALALQYLHSIQATLFPALIHMIFDPEKKGPSEFTTRNIITSLLFTYIESASPQERIPRAKAVLSYLRDPKVKEEEKPLEFVLEMRRERPYRVWDKEVVSVTKEVFWIFLHNLNVVALPASADKSSKGILSTATNGQKTNPGGRASTEDARGGKRDDPYGYMARHFPQERPPVPAAPYVGGVEWDATNYLASHVDLLNAILACTPDPAERNQLRGQLRISGWERCLGGSLRLCKEKFYPCVHDGLRTWVAAAAEDGWDVRDVRFGPPAEPRSGSPGKKAGGGGKRKGGEEAPPRLDMPKLDFALDGKVVAAP